MPTTPKRAAQATSKQAPSVNSAQSSKPFLRFHHSKDLRTRTLEVLAAVESADRATTCSEQLIEVVLELIDVGLDQYFVQSLKAAKVNFLVEQSAVLGLSGVEKVMATVIRNILGRMDDRQLLSVCSSIRQFMA